MYIPPFFNGTQKQEQKITLFLVIFTVVFIALMRYFDSFLANEIAPYGIVSFELAFDVETATAILNSWNESAKVAAGLSLGSDVLFPFFYGGLIAMLIHKLNRNLWKNTRWYAFGNLMAWTLVVAIVFDLIENTGLIQMLMGNISTFWVSVSSYAAMFKFFIILGGISYILINFGVFLIKKGKK